MKGLGQMFSHHAGITHHLLQRELRKHILYGNLW